MSIETEMAINSNFQGNMELPPGASFQSLPPNSIDPLALEPAFDEDGNPIEPSLSQDNTKMPPPETKYNKDEIKEFVELKPAIAAQVLRAMMIPEEE